MVIVSFVAASLELIYVPLSFKAIATASSDRWRGSTEETVRISGTNAFRLAASKDGPAGTVTRSRSHSARSQVQTLLHPLQVATTDGIREEGRASG